MEKADPQPGQTLLDIAAGTGDLGFAVAERVGEDGHVISTDFSPKMIEVARRNGERRGLTQVEYRVLDAEKMELDDDSVDGVVCRWGYMLMADPAAALKETRRVLRDGGPLAFAVWTGPDRNPWAAVPAKTVVQRGHMPPPEPGAPGIFAMGDPDRIGELVMQAGFGEPELEEIAFEFRYPASTTSGTHSSASRVHSPARSTHCPMLSGRRQERPSCRTSSPTANRTVPTPCRRQRGAFSCADRYWIESEAESAWFVRYVGGSSRLRFLLTTSSA